MGRRRSPQEKKALSYAKDRRNEYGENDKSSRKNIPRSKKFPHRANRRRACLVLEAAKGAVDEAAESAVEERLLARRPKSWKKWRDAPLGEVVQYVLRRRIKRAERLASNAFAGGCSSRSSEVSGVSGEVRPGGGPAFCSPE